MSAKTRIKRPTTSTPRKGPIGRMVHQSTNYGWIASDPKNPSSARFVKLGRGNTYWSK